jgi:hypothetical protein
MQYIKHDKEQVKKLRDTLTTFGVFETTYTIRPNRISVVPKKTVPCRFDDKCRKNVANCNFYHSAAKDRHLKVLLTAQIVHRKYLEMLIPGIELEQSEKIQSLCSAVVWMPYTATLEAIIQEHRASVDQKLKDNGEWKTFLCTRETEHDEETCRYAHVAEE